MIIYHRTSQKSIDKISQEGFRVGGGNMYHNGLYGTYDLESQLKQGMEKYGNCLLQCEVTATNFLIFDYALAKKLYGQKFSLVSQLKTLNLWHYIEEEQRKAVKMDDYYRPKTWVIELSRKLNTAKFTSDYVKSFMTADFYKLFQDQINGLCFTGRHDGKVCVVRKLVLQKPISWCFINDMKWKPINFVPIKPKQMPKSIQQPFKHGAFNNKIATIFENLTVNNLTLKSGKYIDNYKAYEKQYYGKVVSEDDYPIYMMSGTPDVITHIIKSFFASYETKELNPGVIEGSNPTKKILYYILDKRNSVYKFFITADYYINN